MSVTTQGALGSPIDLTGAARARRAFSRLVSLARRAARNRATRRELARLDHHLLRDIGLSRTDLAAEPGTIIATRRQRIAEVARSVRGFER